MQYNLFQPVKVLWLVVMKGRIYIILNRFSLPVHLWVIRVLVRKNFPRVVVYIVMGDVLTWDIMLISQLLEEVCI